MMEQSEVTQKIIGCAMTVHRTLGPGFLESVYQNALAHEMRKAGFEVECERRLQVTYDGVVVGDFSADMLVNRSILIENKAVQTLVPAHEVQLVNYLTATGIEIGLLLNFGTSKLEFKRKTRIYHPKKSGQDEQDSQDKNQGDLASRPANPVNPVKISSSRQDEQDSQDKNQGDFASRPANPVNPVKISSSRQDEQDLQDKNQGDLASYPAHPVNPVKILSSRQDEQDGQDENPVSSSALHPVNPVHPV